MIGYVEYTYLEKMPEERKEVIYEQLLSYDIPYLIYSTKVYPDELMLKKANEKNIPVFATDKNVCIYGGGDTLAEWWNLHLASPFTVF